MKRDIHLQLQPDLCLNIQLVKVLLPPFRKKKRIDFDQLLLENNKIFWILVKIHILDHFKHFNCFFIKIFIIVGTFEEN